LKRPKKVARRTKRIKKRGRRRRLPGALTTVRTNRVKTTMKNGDPKIRRKRRNETRVRLLNLIHQSQQRNRLRALLVVMSLAIQAMKKLIEGIGRGARVHQLNW